jgi:HK97 gp10 family phage protein
MITLQVRGADAVERTLRDIAPKHALALTRATVGALTTEITKDAKKNMNFTGRYSTGMMKKHTKKKIRKVRGGIVQNDIVVGRRAFYWRYYEYGQGGNPRKRMFEKALMDMNGKLATRWEELFMKKLVQRLARERKRQGLR